MSRAQIKDEKTYEGVRRSGASKEKAARVADAAAGGSRSKTGRKGGRAGEYEGRSKQDLYQEAKKVGIKGRSEMSKEQLIKALREH